MPLKKSSPVPHPRQRGISFATQTTASPTDSSTELETPEADPRRTPEAKGQTWVVGGEFCWSLVSRQGLGRGGASRRVERQQLSTATAGVREKPLGRPVWGGAGLASVNLQRCSTSRSSCQQGDRGGEGVASPSSAVLLERVKRSSKCGARSATILRVGGGPYRPIYLDQATGRNRGE